MTLDKFTVRIALRQDNPAFPKYQIFISGRLIGTQFSVPSLSDCQWHERETCYAETSRYRPLELTRGKYLAPKRGRPSNEERARRIAQQLVEETQG